MMATMNEELLQEQLRAEGFRKTYVWQDNPGAFYPEHTHATETAHIILEGEMTLTTNGGMRTYRAGERCDVPAGAEHCARGFAGVSVSHWRAVSRSIVTPREARNRYRDSAFPFW